MNRYERYKNSGIPWLGEVPDHWETWKITHAIDLIGSGTTPKSDNAEYYDGDILWVTTSELRENFISDTKQKVSDNAIKEYSALKIYPANSVAMAMYGATIGRLGILEREATFNQACCVFGNSKILYYKFLFYWLWHRRPILISLSNGGGQPNLSQDDLKKLKLPIPSYEEQTIIAHYLDTKLGEIDALIDKQQTLLEKLAEQRTAVITHAVTKGLNPAAPMKNSGVEWLGDVPAHWEVKRLRFTLNLNPVKSELNIPEDTLVSFIPMEAVNFDKDLTLTEERNLDEVYKGYTYFKNDDVVLAKITPCFENGKSAIAQNLTNGIAFGTTELHVLRPQDSINNHFLYYLIKSDSFMKIGESEMYGAGGQKRVPEEFIKNFLIGLPPYYEQVTIADYLDQETAKIDRLCDTVNQTIGRLKEYRTALITQAVTGKIKVTDE